MFEEKKSLNQEQIKAIRYGEGPLLIIAGAGTGKTTVITERIKYLILSGKAKPQEVLALTFTEKAALEMEERVDKIMPFGFFQMWIGTFHSFGDRVLREEAIHIGLNPHFVLMTEAEAILFLRKNLFNFELEYFRPAGNPYKFLEDLLSHFNRLKDEDILPSQYLAWAKKQKENLFTQENKEEVKKNLELAKAYQKYEELKIKEGVMDFADLISQTLRLFRERKNILKKYQQKFKYILVDEFQDTNISQNQLVTLLAGEKANLTVVADDDQSIYKWRGAAISNVLQFKKTYPNAKVITLTKNYRSTQEILDRAYDLIQYNNPDRLEVQEKINKRLTSARKIKGEKIKFLMAERVEDEAEMVAEEIKKLAKKYQFKQIAILVRANNHADVFVRTFLRKGIPFQFLGPGKLFKQEEIKDLIAWLRVLANFEDNVAFFRVLTLPIFDISARDIAAVRNYAKKFNFSLFEAAEQADKILISEESRKKIKKIVELIHRHLNFIPHRTAGQILYDFLEESGWLKQMAEVKSQKEELRVTNIAKFFDKLKTYEAEHEDASVEAVVDWLNLKMEMGESPLAGEVDWVEENKVNILTVHSAKGLEFSVVFLVNLVNERFPSREQKEQIPIPQQLIKEVLPQGDSHQQEERRLFYVGMTRAKDLLYFTAAKFYGEGKRMKKISPFVFEALGRVSAKGVNFSRQKQLSIFDFKPTKDLFYFLEKPLTINYLSYSQIECFTRCPLEYKYRFLLKIPVPPSAAASFGVSLHQALKDFYQRLKNKKSVNKKNLWKLLENNWQKEGYNSKTHEQKMFLKAKKILADFLKKGYKKTDNPIALEQEFSFKISPFLRIGGRIDRIDDLGARKIEVIDYKTGKALSLKEAEKDLQLTIYAMAVCYQGEYQRKPEEVTLSFYFLEEQKKISTKRTQNDFKKAQDFLLNKAKEIEESSFLPKPGVYCDFCAFKLLCPAWQ